MPFTNPCMQGIDHANEGACNHATLSPLPELAVPEPILLRRHSGPETTMQPVLCEIDAQQAASATPTARLMSSNICCKHGHTLHDP